MTVMLHFITCVTVRRISILRVGTATKDVPETSIHNLWWTLPTICAHRNH